MSRRICGRGFCAACLSLGVIHWVEGILTGRTSRYCQRATLMLRRTACIHARICVSSSPLCKLRTVDVDRQALIAHLLRGANRGCSANKGSCKAPRPCVSATCSSHASVCELWICELVNVVL
ncbi:uncharacterized protein F5Z01DRAFT_644441 [Emericellopsis atlantica]|uniref:Secreted protein n=1 Tax=Emericellopsis atlantica TaxID=2614577 RepID=A0A9P8CT46_9HYPO|nr:uncharacterized protein F5Z01DRAFT_644441 [Emericellopsis atlantica]KAG9257865.1 hypothetical protein F5Z01DRAFT_644441 [Emericellopsis atlantica]